MYALPLFLSFLDYFFFDIVAAGRAPLHQGSSQCSPLYPSPRRRRQVSQSPNSMPELRQLGPASREPPARRRNWISHRDSDGECANGKPRPRTIAAACPDLEVLYLSRASDCTEDGVSALANSCRKLRKLHIDAWSRFGIRTIGDDRVLSIATRCANLQEVVLMGIPATIGSFNVLASNCPALERMAGVHRRQIHSPEEALLLLRYKFENALSLNRRRSSSSIHAPR